MNHIRVNLPTGESYTLLPETSIESFESLNLGEQAFTYEHVRTSIGRCWGCPRPIWNGQEFIIDEDEREVFHALCYI